MWQIVCALAALVALVSSQAGESFSHLLLIPLLLDYIGFLWVFLCSMVAPLGFSTASDRTQYDAVCTLGCLGSSSCSMSAAKCMKDLISFLS